MKNNVLTGEVPFWVANLNLILMRTFKHGSLSLVLQYYRADMAHLRLSHYGSPRRDFVTFFSKHVSFARTQNAIYIIPALISFLTYALFFVNAKDFK